MLTLNVRTFGEPGWPALVLMHGLFGSSTNWTSIARRLSARFHVLAPDLRNHGQSPHHEEHSYDAMVDDILGLLDAEGVAQAGLVGHSMGGKVAMHLALNHPQRASGLAVVDISPVTYTHDFEVVLAGFDAVDLPHIASRADADRQMASCINSKGVRAFLLQNLVKQSDGWGWRQNLRVLAREQSQITAFPDQVAHAAFEGPTSFIYGEQSDYVTPDYEPTIRGYFPGAVMCPVADAGHWVYAEQPAAFQQCLDAFLGRLPAV